jgi:UDP-glucuronate decarboxylase
MKWLADAEGHDCGTNLVLTFTPFVSSRLFESDLDVIVTGGGGWIGQATLEMLDQALGAHFPARVHVFGTSGRRLPLRSGRLVYCRALRDIEDLPSRPCLFTHYAFLTKDRVAGLDLRTFVEQNEVISRSVLKQANIRRIEGIFVPSSGAVYRPDRTIDDDLKRNPYGVMKARDELDFLSLAEEFHTRVVICRVFNLAGPFVNKIKSYALSSILMDIIASERIVLRADRPVLRSYVHVRDLIDLAFALMLGDRSPPATPFDTAGELNIEIGELAQRAASILGKPEMPIIRPPIRSEEPDKYVGDGRLFQRLLREFSVLPRHLDTQILDTADYLANFHTGLR